jgi:carboxymethylenebutenolidase
MLIKEDHVDLNTPSGLMRVHRFMPLTSVPRPGIILYSEIFQITGPIARTARRLASEGYIVVAPEVYHEFEPAGCALAYDKEGTDKGNRYKIEKTVVAYDADAKACIAYLKSLPHCDGKIGSMGICLGGHLSFRCAMNAEVLAGVCYYATDIHKGSLGLGMRDDSLARIPELKGEMLMIWGKQDPHVPQAGRDLIYKTMTDAGVNFTWHEFNAQHAFIRDEGHRYDAALASITYALIFELFHRRLVLGQIDPVNGAAVSSSAAPSKLG